MADSLGAGREPEPRHCPSGGALIGVPAIEYQRPSLIERQIRYRRRRCRRRPLGQVRPAGFRVCDRRRYHRKSPAATVDLNIDLSSSRREVHLARLPEIDPGYGRGRLVDRIIQPADQPRLRWKGVVDANA